MNHPSASILISSHGTSPMGALGQNSSEWRNSQSATVIYRTTGGVHAARLPGGPKFNQPADEGYLGFRRPIAGVEVPGLAAQITRRAA